jgi:integrase
MSSDVQSLAQALVAALQTIAQQPIAAAPSPAGGPDFATVLNEYLTSSHFRSLAPASQTPYRHVLTRWVRREQLGSRPVRSLGRREIEAMLARESQGAAHDLLKKIRILLRFAIARGYRDDDPTPGIKAPPINKAHATWTPDELAQYRVYWKLGTRQRLAFELALQLGQRRGDLVSFRWEAIQRGRLTFTQSKTNTPLSLPIGPELGAALDAMKGPRTGPLLRHPRRRRAALEPESFGNMFSDWIREAGLGKHLVLHGLRHTRATQLADAGCSEKEIASWTGHKSLAMVARYTRKANQVKLADAALAKLK